MRKINSLIIIAYSAGIVHPAGACFMSCFGGRATCGCCIPQQIGPEPEIKAIQEKINEHDATLKIIKEKVFAEPIAKTTRQLGVDFGMVNGKFVETNGTLGELSQIFQWNPSLNKAKGKVNMNVPMDQIWIYKEQRDLFEKLYKEFYSKS